MKEGFVFPIPPEEVRRRIDEKIDDPIKRAGAHAFYNKYSDSLEDKNNLSFRKPSDNWRKKALKAKQEAIKYASKFADRGQIEDLPDFTQFGHDSDVFTIYGQLAQLQPEQLQKCIKKDFLSHVDTDRDGVNRYLLLDIAEIAHDTPFSIRLKSAVAAELNTWNPTPEGMTYGVYIIEITDRLQTPGRTARYLELALDPGTDVRVYGNDLKADLLRKVAYDCERTEAFDAFWEIKLKDPRFFEEAYIYFREKSITDGINHLPMFVEMLRKEQNQTEPAERFHTLRDNLVYFIFKHTNDVDGIMSDKDTNAFRECLKGLVPEDRIWITEALNAEFGDDYSNRMQFA